MNTPSTADPAANADRDPLFLPSFCDMRMVFAVVVLAELFAFVLVLASTPTGADRWARLGVLSLLVQWIALTSAALLCLARPGLRRLSNAAAALISYLLLLVVAAAISELAWQVISAAPAWTLGDPGTHDGFLLRNVGISAVISGLALRYFFVRHQWRRQLEAEARARIEALQARIRPHFLFNSLNTIAALTRSQPEQAEEAVEDLADLFRATLAEVHAEVPLAQELEVCRRYVHMESLRLGERLRVQWDVSGGLVGTPVPALVLQPLLENAIYHGIEPRSAGGLVRVGVRGGDGWLHLEVCNPLPPAGRRCRRAGNGMALANIGQRLRLAYGDSASLHIQESADEHCVRLRIPLQGPQTPGTPL
ncbi:MAG: sensor histidine kinase [Gammaproteobacteria bacterium]